MMGESEVSEPKGTYSVSCQCANCMTMFRGPFPKGSLIPKNIMCPVCGCMTGRRQDYGIAREDPQANGKE
jgi:hypothetical protein